MNSAHRAVATACVNTAPMNARTASTERGIGAVVDQDQPAGADRIAIRRMVPLPGSRSAWVTIHSGADQPVDPGKRGLGPDQLPGPGSQPGKEFIPPRGRDRLREQGPHRRPHRLDRERVNAIVDQDQPTGPDRVAGPQDGAEVAGIAQRLGDNPQWRRRAVSPRPAPSRAAGMPPSSICGLSLPDIFERISGIV